MIREEARKGYGMLVAGLDRAVTRKGIFRADLEDVARGFDGPLCFVLGGAGTSGEIPGARRANADPRPGQRHRGGPPRRRFRAGARPRARNRRQGALRVEEAATHRSWIFHQREEAVLREVVDLAGRYGVRVETAMRSTGHPDKAICRRRTAASPWS